MPTEIPRAVLALGAYTLNREGKQVRRGRAPVEAAARASFPSESVRIVSIADFADFEELFGATVEAAGDLKLMKLAGAASGQLIQEALEGHRVTDIHIDLTGTDDVLEQSQVASELRNVIAHLRTGEPRKVGLHFRHEKGLSSINKAEDRVTGAPLPGFLRRHLSSAQFPDADVGGETSAG